MGKEKLDTRFKKTANARGYAIEVLDTYSEHFIEEAVRAGSSDEYCLEVGAAFGFVTKEALTRGAKMIANDVSAEHLDAILQDTPSALKSSLTLLKGEFPAVTGKMPDASIKHILICRVTHYFTPAQMELAIKECSRLLAPEGKVFLVSETPYGAVFKDFIPIYEGQKQTASNWPGFIDDLPKYMRQYSEDNPSKMLLLGEDELRAGFLRAGFSIEKCGFFSRAGVFPEGLCLDGKESVGIVAVKPPIAKL
jgi:ubiquinone/menaquinone biosynthesis C-methylase UbiE